METVPCLSSVLAHAPSTEKLFRPVAGSDCAVPNEPNDSRKKPNSFFIIESKNPGTGTRKREGTSRTRRQTMVEQRTLTLPPRTEQQLSQCALFSSSLTTRPSLRAQKDHHPILHPVCRLPHRSTDLTSRINAPPRSALSDEFFRPFLTLTPSLAPPSHSTRQDQRLLACSTVHLPANHAPLCLARRNISLSRE